MACAYYACTNHFSFLFSFHCGETTFLTVWSRSRQPTGAALSILQEMRKNRLNFVQNDRGRIWQNSLTKSAESGIL